MPPPTSSPSLPDPLEVNGTMPGFDDLGIANSCFEAHRNINPNPPAVFATHLNIP